MRGGRIKRTCPKCEGVRVTCSWRQAGEGCPEGDPYRQPANCEGSRHRRKDQNVQERFHRQCPDCGYGWDTYDVATLTARASA